MPDIWQLPAPLLKQLKTKRSPLKEKIGTPWLVRRAGRGESESLACTLPDLALFRLGPDHAPPGGRAARTSDSRFDPPDDPALREGDRPKLPSQVLK